MLQDNEYFEETCKKVIATRERVKKELKELGFTFPDSKSNFIFANHKTVPAKEIFDASRAAGIYVRWWGKERIDNYLRISIGTDEEMDAFITFLKDYLEK